MKKDDLDSALKHLTDKELVSVIDTVYPIVIDAATNTSSPYHITDHVSDSSSKQHRVSYANLPFIIQDAIVTPIAQQLGERMGLDIYKPEGAYHHLGDDLGLVYPANGLISREVIPTSLGLDRIAGQLKARLDDDWRSERLGRRRESRRRRVIAGDGTYSLVNLDEHVWSEIGQHVQELLEDYLAERHRNLSQSSYFPQKLPFIGYIDLCAPDVLVGSGTKVAKPIIGIDHGLDEGKDWKYKQEHLKIELTEDGELAIKNLADIVKAHVVGQVSWAMSAPGAEGVSSYGGRYTMRWEQFAQGHLPYDLGTHLSARTSGVYFDKPGVYFTPVNRLVMMPVDFDIEPCWLPAEELHRLAGALWSTGISYLDAVKEERVMVDATVDHGSSRTTHGLIVTHDDDKMPSKTLALNNLNECIRDKILRTLERSLPYEQVRFAESKKMKPGLVYLCEGSVTWRADDPKQNV